MKIEIPGQVPAQKNQKKMSYRNGKPVLYTAKAVKDWQRDAQTFLQAHYKGSADGKVYVYYMFYVKDKRRRDLDNMIATVNDALVRAGLLIDDDWTNLGISGADAELDRDNPRVEVFIDE